MFFKELNYFYSEKSVHLLWNDENMRRADPSGALFIEMVRNEHGSIHNKQS